MALDDEASTADDEVATTKAEHADEKPATVDHDTLKYHLLGPSLTKAGQDSVDQQKVRLKHVSTSTGYN